MERSTGFLPQVSTRPFRGKKNSVALCPRPNRTLWRGHSCKTVCAMSQIEVERKFNLDGVGVESLIEACSSKKEKEFQDCYFCEELAFNDIWLRMRGSEWELKLPVAGNTDIALGATAYKEVTGDSVWQELSRIGIPYDKKTFATINTLRNIMILPWNRYQIAVTLDQCSSNDGFQYTIGEIEILVGDAREVKNAIKALDDVMTHFVLMPVGQEEGKLLRYLRENNLRLFEKLVANMLRKRA